MWEIGSPGKFMVGSLFCPRLAFFSQAGPQLCLDLREAPSNSADSLTSLLLDSWGSHTVSPAGWGGGGTSEF